MPGCLIAIARLNRPAVFVYGGTILPGCINGRNLDIVWSLKLSASAQTVRSLKRKLTMEAAIPGAGACGGMYTANTMAAPSKLWA